MEALHPIAYLERERLERQLDRRHAGRWLKLGAYTFVTLVAAIPFVVYITEQAAFLLVFMAAIIIPAQIMVIVRTLMLAVERVVSERTTGTWDTLVMTGISARQIVGGKWWAVTRAMLPEWMFIAVARFGLAYGLAQYLHTMNWSYCLQQFPNVFCYQSPSGILMNPHVITVGFAAVFLCIITLLELDVVGGMGLLAGLLPTQNRITILAVASLLWLLLVGIGLISSTILNPVKQWIFTEYGCSLNTLCDHISHLNIPETIHYTNDVSRAANQFQTTIHESHRIVEVVQVSATTLTDGGTLLAANTMRPYIRRFILFLLQNTISAVVAIFGYKSLRWIFLFLARRLAVQHGALPDKRRIWLRII